MASSWTWPVAKLALYIPIQVVVPMTLAQFVAYNGATVSGNIDLGLYTTTGTAVSRLGPTANGGAAINVVSAYDVADISLGTGDYYMALACDNVTQTFFRTTPGVGSQRSMGVLQQDVTNGLGAGVFGLPATATFAACSQNMMPVIGVLGRVLL